MKPKHKVEKDKWVWMPHAAHFICADSCKFRMATNIGKYIVSTVGEYVAPLNTDKFTEIGFNRLYETMVFKSEKSKEKCCPYTPKSFEEIDFEGYNDPKLAYKGHLKMCEKWSKL